MGENFDKTYTLIMKKALEAIYTRTLYQQTFLIFAIAHCGARVTRTQDMAVHIICNKSFS